MERDYEDLARLSRSSVVSLRCEDGSTRTDIQSPHADRSLADLLAAASSERGRKVRDMESVSAQSRYVSRSHINSGADRQ